MFHYFISILAAIITSEIELALHMFLSFLTLLWHGWL